MENDKNHLGTCVIRRVELQRGRNGFGFVIGGQKPCRIESLCSGGEAEKAGLRVGDVILEVNGFDVRDACQESIVTFVSLSQLKTSVTLLQSRLPPRSKTRLHRVSSHSCFGEMFATYQFQLELCKKNNFCCVL